MSVTGEGGRRAGVTGEYLERGFIARIGDKVNYCGYCFIGFNNQGGRIKDITMLRD